jgi:hypothetical protein
MKNTSALSRDKLGQFSVRVRSRDVRRDGLRLYHAQKDTATQEPL